ncbi:hypothetical protein M9Y10_004658, partial [Tritrichomonas musculus]
MLSRIDNEVKNPRDRNIIKFLYTECEATDETINALINVANNGRDAYGDGAYYRFNEFRTTWPAGTWLNERADPIRADQVEGTKKKFMRILPRFIEAVDKYLNTIEDPRNQVYYTHRVKNARLASTLKFLYFTCHVSKEIVDNMIHIINNPDLYKDELQQTLNEMGSIWLGYSGNNADVKKDLRQRLINMSETYFTNPNLYLKSQPKPPQIPLSEFPDVEPPGDPLAEPPGDPIEEPPGDPLAEPPGDPIEEPPGDPGEDSGEEEAYSEVKYSAY